MVTMIPKTRQGDKNYGEEVLFEGFNEVKNRPDWIVVHSLKQRKVAQGIQSETDFVVFVPGKGIVLIEVKGATSAIFDDNTWTMTGVHKDAVNKDPFDQIDRASANIVKQMRIMELDHNDVTIARIAWFPRLDEHKFTAGKDSGMSFAPYEIALATNLKTIVGTIEDCLDRTIKANKSKTDHVPVANPLSVDMARQLAKHIVGSLIMTQSLDQKAKMRALAIQQAALEHEFMIDLIDQNQGIYFEGAAGAGKSSVLRKAAKKFNEEGKQVLFLTYNLLLEEDTQKSLRDLELVDVYSINDLLLGITGKASNPKNATTNWYEVDLPKQALQILRDESKPKFKYDAIIIDEFQDFANKTLWLKIIAQILESSKKRRPSILIAGDDMQRTSVGSKSIPSLEVAKMFFPNLFHVVLKTNVRQAPKLVEEIYAFLGRPNPFRRNLLSEANVGSLQIIKIKAAETEEKTRDSELKKLSEVVEGLLADYKASSIRVLSPFGEHKAALVRAFSLGDTHSKQVRALKKLTKHTSNPTGQIRWRSIMKFKGLDSDVVIITDINNAAKNFAEERLRVSLDDLLYMGMTRARFEVILLVQDDLYSAK